VSDGSEFLKTILDAPDEDPPRLVYADWLEENGDPDRAEFIRIQCELFQLGERDPRRARLRAREQFLLRENQMVWIRQLPELEDAHWESFERGFVGMVRFESAESFAAQADRVFASAPVREARFHRMYQDGARRLARSPHLARVRILDLEDGNAIGNVGLEALAASPFLAGMTALRLRSNAIGPAGVRALANSPHVGALADLSLDNNAVYDEGVRAIGVSPRLAQLARLSLGWTRCGDPAVAALADSPYLAGLRWLYLSGNQIGDDGLTALAESEHLTQLRELYVEANRIGDDGARAVAGSNALAGLTSLYLKGNQIGDAGARALIQSPHLSAIVELVLVENRISSATSDALRARFGQRVWTW
jgi:uncharacterized protein (TIGR02996 family)